MNGSIVYKLIMANSKLKCKQCKSYQLRIEMIKVPVGNFCCQNCIDEFISEKQEKDRQKQLKKAYGRNSGRKKGKTQAHCDNDLKTRKEAAKKACHTYIRERDKNQLCICCGKHLGENYQAGHYIESGNNPKIRYDENNIHGQRLDCNYFKGGDHGMYRVNLIKKIGLKEVERLESMKGGTVKRMPEDYKEIETYYKEKLNEIREND